MANLRTNLVGEEKYNLNPKKRGKGFTVRDAIRNTLNKHPKEAPLVTESFRIYESVSDQVLKENEETGSVSEKTQATLEKARKKLLSDYEKFAVEVVRETYESTKTVRLKDSNKALNFFEIAGRAINNNMWSTFWTIPGNVVLKYKDLLQNAG